MKTQSPKIFLFLVLFTLLWLPLLQEKMKWLPEPALNGAYVKPHKPTLTLDSLQSLEFQQNFEDYENSNFGFRGFLVKFKNSLNYILFKDLSVEDNTAGKDGVIFSIGSIYRTFGQHYSGKEKNTKAINKIEFLRRGLGRRGRHLLVAIAPSKESVMPDFRPVQYTFPLKEQTDYNDFVTGYKERSIPFIDFSSYLKKVNDTCAYPVFTKTGFHWSLYWASYVQDSLVNYVEKLVGKPLPHYKRNGYEVSDTARDPDADFEIPQNMLFSMGQAQYRYPKLEMMASTTGNFRPKVIIIGDSFFWQIKHQKMLMHIFSEDSKFWFYFARHSFPLGDVPGVPLESMNIMKELESADVVLLVGNIGTIGEFPFGVADYYYDNIAANGVLNAIKNNLKGNSVKMGLIKEEARTKAITPEEALQEKAKEICRDRNLVRLVGTNGKYLCAGGEEAKAPLANRDQASDWETFSMVELGNGEVAFYSYKNRFLSAELHSTKEISGTRENIGAWEIFRVVKLEKEFIAIQASNGKYISLDEKSGKLYATATSIGKNEKFKCIEVNR